MASSTAKLTFRFLLVAVVALILFYVGRPLYWKISATVHDIRHNKQTVSGEVHYSAIRLLLDCISQIVQEAQRSVGWFHDESDSGFNDNKKSSSSARRFLLGQVFINRKEYTAKFNFTNQFRIFHSWRGQKTENENAINIHSNDDVQLSMFLDPLVAKTVFRINTQYHTPLHSTPLHVQRRASRMDEALEKLYATGWDTRSSVHNVPSLKNESTEKAS
ncbi:hypothetical protein SASPL_103770 [Salvia splendens]|uniref:Uncharacterized protein n=1 Tax=Salvia splendens TaxID=180675 RepID=A0A8X8YLL2_SALSN|nr:hypothetical protein SASPL_103770 [Salvia splendens]